VIAMTDALKSELRRIAAAVAFPAAGVVAFAGRSLPQAGAAAANPMAGMQPAANPLVAQLQQLLYEGCYCRPFTGAPPQPPAPSAQNGGFVEALSAGNASRERWDAGWQIRQLLPSGQVAVVKGAMSRLVWPGEFLAHGAPGTAPRPGAEVSLFAPRESRTMQPGFYFSFGEALGDQEDEFAIVRLYWNVRADGAARLIGGVTQALNRYAVPFRCKCLSVPSYYDRTDAAVLYLGKRHYRIAAALLAESYPKLRPLLDQPTPLFSKPLADGLGLAENPRSGESFGMHCCRLVAEAICAAHARASDTPQARLDAIAAAFAGAGQSLDRPYLNPGSADRYDFAVPAS
jgi:hypothetical protein